MMTQTSHVFCRSFSLYIQNVIITTLPMLLLMLSYLSGKKVRSQIPELDY